jgi:Ca2+-binding RTX toxin-like protein
MGEPVIRFGANTFGDVVPTDVGGVMDGGTGSDTFFVDLAFSGFVVDFAFSRVLSVDGGVSLAGDTDTINFGSQATVWENGVPANVGTNLLDLESGNGLTPFGGVLTVARVENITGGEYRDQFFGDDGANTLLGMANDDVLEGRGGGDTLNGGAGRDVAQYTSSPLGVDVDLLRATQLLGDAAGDRLISIEEVRGSNFGDILRGTNAGVGEVLFGGGGDDTLEGRSGADTLNGGSGFDFASYESSGTPLLGFGVGVNVLLPRPGFIPAETGGHAAGDTLVSIEGLIGSAFADTLTGNDERNELRGGDGADTLSGLGGTDTLRGGNGADKLYGGTQKDTLDGGFGNDLLDGGGDDIDTADFSSWTGYTIAQSIRIELGLNGADGIAERKSLSVLETDTLRLIENVQGSNWAETIKGNELSNNLHGGGGADRLEGGGQNDVLNGGLGLDTLVGGTGLDGFKFDTALGAGNIDSIVDYNVADDTIYLGGTVFTALANPGFDYTTLSTSAFAVGTAALDGSDR